jgi:sec-independent protein translocase protein TatC
MNSPTLLRELGELRSIIIRFAITLFAIAVGMLAFGTPSLASRLFLALKDHLVPQGVSVVALGPLSPFIAPISVAFIVAFILSFPYLFFLIARYLAPALYGSERRALFILLISSTALFFLGCLFSYTLLIPATFAILYSFAGPLGVTPLFSLDAFISSVFGLTISAGVAFLTPVVMIALSATGLVPPAFWRLHWRGAVATAIIFSAVITPDGSGVTMVILSIPLMLLYGVGIVGSGRALFTNA